MSNRNDKNQVTQENTEKVMTKYDRKMQARKEAEHREKVRSRQTLIAVAAAVILIAIITIVVPVTKNINAKKEYIKVGTHSVNKIEYDFYYGYTVNTFLNNYAAILSYMNLDTTLPFSQQQFNDELTWEDYFNQMTASNIRQYFALADDAKTTGYEYDAAADYDEFYTNMESAANEDNMSLKRYLKAAFGDYATKSALKNSIETFLTAQSYYTNLIELNTPSEDEITAHYNENKNDYDTVDYNIFSIAADAGEDASEEEITAAMDAAKAAAEEFASRYTAGEAFSDLCKEYAAEKDAETYEEEDASLRDAATYSNTAAAYRDWLFDAERTAGEVTTIEDSDTDTWYIIAFQTRETPETVNDTISSALASDATQEYVTELIEDYEIIDEKNHLNLALVTEPTPTPTPAPENTEDVSDDSSDDTEDVSEPTPSAAE